MAIRYKYGPAERAVHRKEIRETYDSALKDSLRREEQAMQRLKAVDHDFFQAMKSTAYGPGWVDREFDAGLDPRRKQEAADSGMIREDVNGMANLPRQAIHAEYPRGGYYTSPYIDNAKVGNDEGDYSREV
jgi:hypothetical protein